MLDILQKKINNFIFFYINQCKIYLIWTIIFFFYLFVCFCFCLSKGGGHSNLFLLVIKVHVTNKTKSRFNWTFIIHQRWNKSISIEGQLNNYVFKYYTNFPLSWYTCRKDCVTVCLPKLFNYKCRLQILLLINLKKTCLFKGLFKE